MQLGISFSIYNWKPQLYKMDKSIEVLSLSTFDAPLNKSSEHTIKQALLEQEFEILEA